VTVRLLLGLFLLVSAFNASAQSTAGAALDGGRLTLGADTLWTYFVRGRDTMPTGFVVDHLQRARQDGQEILRRVYRSENRLTGPQVDTLIDLWPSLAPRGHRSYSARGIERLEFSSSRAQGHIRMPTGDSIAVDVALPSAVYNSATFDLTLRAAPLSESWRTTIPTFVTSTRSVVSMNARVAGSAVIDGRECWRVEAEFMAMPVTFWIAKDDRSLRQQVLRPQAGVSFLFLRQRPSGPARRAT
jgi:hypothetical protein